MNINRQLRFLKENATYISGLDGMKPYTSRIRFMGNRPEKIAKLLDSFVTNKLASDNNFMLTVDELVFIEFANSFISLFKTRIPRLYNIEFQLDVLRHRNSNFIPIELADDSSNGESRDNLEQIDLFQFSRQLFIGIPPARKVVYNSNVYPKPDECCVCYENIVENDRLSCGHYIHKQCIINSQKPQCSICRQDIELSQEDLDKISNEWL